MYVAGRCKPGREAGVLTFRTAARYMQQAQAATRSGYAAQPRQSSTSLVSPSWHGQRSQLRALTSSSSCAWAVCPAVKYPSNLTTGGYDARGDAAVCHFMLTSGMPARCFNTCTGTGIRHTRTGGGCRSCSKDSQGRQLHRLRRFMTVRFTRGGQCHTNSSSVLSRPAAHCRPQPWPQAGTPSPELPQGPAGAARPWGQHSYSL